MIIQNIHHIAIIASDYPRSKSFYTQILGLQIIKETYREEKKSYKLDLALNDNYVIELFSFPDYVTRASYPEALGLRHLAFAVNNINEAIDLLDKHAIVHEGIRIDETTNKRFTFFQDPDGLPLEFYEA